MVKLNIPMPKECRECPCYLANKAWCVILVRLGKPFIAPDIFSHERYQGCPMEEIVNDQTAEG